MQESFCMNLYGTHSGRNESWLPAPYISLQNGCADEGGEEPDGLADGVDDAHECAGVVGRDVGDRHHAPGDAQRDAGLRGGDAIQWVIETLIVFKLSVEFCVEFCKLSHNTGFISFNAVPNEAKVVSLHCSYTIYQCHISRPSLYKKYQYSVAFQHPIELHPRTRANTTMAT